MYRSVLTVECEVYLRTSDVWSKWLKSGWSKSATIRVVGLVSGLGTVVGPAVRSPAAVRVPGASWRVFTYGTCAKVRCQTVVCADVYATRDTRVGGGTSPYPTYHNLNTTYTLTKLYFKSVLF